MWEPIVRKPHYSDPLKKVPQPAGLDIHMFVRHPCWDVMFSLSVEYSPKHNETSKAPYRSVWKLISQLYDYSEPLRRMYNW